MRSPSAGRALLLVCWLPFAWGTLSTTDQNYICDVIEAASLGSVSQYHWYRYFTPSSVLYSRPTPQVMLQQPHRRDGPLWLERLPVQYP